MYVYIYGTLQHSAPDTDDSSISGSDWIIVCTNKRSFASPKTTIQIPIPTIYNNKKLPNSVKFEGKSHVNIEQDIGHPLAKLFLLLSQSS